MKRCPECRRDYYDDTLLYCLDDGTALLEGPASGKATEALPSEDAPTLPQWSQTPTPSAKPGDGEQKPRGRDRRLLIAGLLLTITVLGVYFGYRYLQHEGGEEVRSIAVLPFENRSGNAETDYLSDGLADSLIYRLSQLPNLKVSPTSSVTRYRGKETDVAEVAEQLKVDALISGRLVQVGSDLNISVQLIDARTQRLIWAEQYDRKMSDLLTTQREIAGAVVQNLKLKLNIADQPGLTKRYTENSEAYRLYLKGRYFWDKRTIAGNEAAIANYNAAIALDQNYALAYAGLADCYIFPKTGQSPHITIPQATAFATKALELDDTLAEAHNTLAFIKMRYEYDWAGAEAQFKRAIELNPGFAVAHQFYGGALINTGRPDEGLREVGRAVELEPLSVTINWSLGVNLFHTRRYDEAITQLNKALEMNPTHELALSSLATAFATKGMYSDALTTLDKLDLLLRQPSQLEGQYNRAYVYALSGRRDDALRLLAGLKDKPERQYGRALGTAKIYTALGEADRAVASLEQAYDDRDFGMIMLAVDPAFDPLRDHPGFKKLLEKVGVPGPDHLGDSPTKSISLDFKSDPADEIIAATSIVERIPRLTRDRKILKSRIVPLAT